MQLATVGGNGASNNLGHIAAAITASGGKIVTGNIASGNTLAMLLTGMTFNEVAVYVEDNQLIDKLSDLLYNVIRSVKNNV